MIPGILLLCGMIYVVILYKSIKKSWSNSRDLFYFRLSYLNRFEGDSPKERWKYAMTHWFKGIEEKDAIGSFSHSSRSIYVYLPAIKDLWDREEVMAEYTYRVIEHEAMHKGIGECWPFNRKETSEQERLVKEHYIMEKVGVLV